MTSVDGDLERNEALCAVIKNANERPSWRFWGDAPVGAVSRFTRFLSVISSRFKAYFKTVRALIG